MQSKLSYKKCRLSPTGQGLMEKNCLIFSEELTKTEQAALSIFSNIRVTEMSLVCGQLHQRFLWCFFLWWRCIASNNI